MRTTRSPWLVAIAIVLGGASFGCESRSTPTAPSPSPTCEFTIAPDARAFPDTGGTGAVSVTTAAGCAWTTASPAAWVTMTSATSGSGPGSVTYSVVENAAADAREAVLTVEGQRHTITQSGRAPTACVYAIDPPGAYATKDAATGEFSVTAPSGCPWTAVSGAEWLVVTAGGQGSGTGRVAYSIARNSSIEPRTAAIAVAGLGFTVRQFGDEGICQYEVTPVEFQPCMPSGALAAAITTGASCPWTVTSAAPWLTVLGGGSGRGPATIRFAFTENYDAPRTGVIEVRWPTPTAGQNLRVMQAGCRYAVSRTQIAVTAAGGAGTFDVLQQSEPLTCGGATQDRCLWSARADVDWITVTTSMPRRGDDRVSFTTAPNASGASRTGHITVRDRTVTVVQAAQ